MLCTDLQGHRWIILAGDGVGCTSLIAQVEEKLCDTLFAVGILAGRIDDPDLTATHSSRDSSTFRVARDELHVLDT